MFYRMIGSNLKTTSKFTIIGYMGTYFAIACSLPLSLANYFIVGWLTPDLDAIYTDSWKIMVGCIVVFQGISPICFAIYRHRVGDMPFWKALYENLKWYWFFSECSFRKPPSSCSETAMLTACPSHLLFGHLVALVLLSAGPSAVPAHRVVVHGQGARVDGFLYQSGQCHEVLQVLDCVLLGHHRSHDLLESICSIRLGHQQLVVHCAFGHAGCRAFAHACTFHCLLEFVI
jgi:hypothetical protein